MKQMTCYMYYLDYIFEVYMYKRRENRRRIKSTGKQALFFIILILVCLAITIKLKINSINKKLLVYEKKEEILKNELEKQENRKKELDEKEIYIKTDEYKIEVAKEKLGLVFPDEILIKPNE